MRKWTYRNEDGERVTVELTEEESELVRAAQAAEDDDDEEDDEDDEHDEDEDDDDPDPPAAAGRVQDTPAEFARVEAAYRQERAAIRASRDPHDLVERRVSMEDLLRDRRQSNIAHTRARDLLGEIEQRELKLRAERLADRRR